MNIAVFYDWQGYDDDVDLFKDCINLFEELHPSIKVNATFTHESLEFSSNIIPAQFCFIDFGGLSGGYGVDTPFHRIRRHMKSLIQENPGKTFIFLLTMGKQWYGDDEIFEFPNVRGEDPGKLLDIFDLYFLEK